MGALHFTQDNFEKEVMQSDVPVFVDFWATWCGPCQAFGPVVEELAAEMEGKVKVGKINVDEEKELAKQFRIFSIPTVVIIKNKEVVARNTGALSLKEAKALLEKAL